jgi:hypothetical protein
MLRQEVDRYLYLRENDLESRFAADLSPDVDAFAFSGSIAGFLREIRRALQ